MKKCRKNEWLSYEIHRQCYENNTKRTRKTEYQSSVNLPYIGSASHKIERILKKVTWCVPAFLVTVVWFTSATLKENKTNREKAELRKSAVAKYSWTNGHRIK